MRLTVTVKQPTGSVVISNALLSIQGEYFVVEMPKQLAENVWDGQRTIYTLVPDATTMKTFTAICTNFVPFMRDGKDMAKAFFVRNEFLNA
jgi:hypothetical protein